MFVDMPPGTGDVPLSIYQSVPLDGIVLVTTPQELVSMIVKKAAVMADKMNIPILGIVENMSYVKCPDLYVYLLAKRSMSLARATPASWKRNTKSLLQKFLLMHL